MAHQLVADGAFIPGIRPARDVAAAVVMASTELNGPRDRVQLDATGEAHLFGRIRLVLQVSDAFRDSAKPGIGAGVQLLDERHHKVSSSLYLLYKAEGFTEPEGEVEATIALGRRSGALRTTLNLTYGQDPKGRERDGEVSTSWQLEITRKVFLGAAARYRDALGSTRELIKRDGFVGGTSALTYGRFGIIAMLGVAMVELHGEQRHIGPASTFAVSVAF